MHYRIEDNVFVKDTGRYGRSLFARKSFKRGDIVFVAFGPVVTRATRFTIPIDHELKIDPTGPEGNICQYICHSCDPNVGIKERTLFVAMKHIRRDEEIVVDYAMLAYEYGGEITEEERACKCGSAICRGKLGCYKELPDEIRMKYEGYISDYLLEDRYN